MTYHNQDQFVEKKKAFKTMQTPRQLQVEKLVS